MFKLTPATRQSLLEDALVDTLLTAAPLESAPPLREEASPAAPAQAVPAR